MYDPENIINTCLNVMTALNADKIQYSFAERKVPDILTLHDGNFTPKVGEHDIVIRNYHSDSEYKKFYDWLEKNPLRNIKASSCFITNMESDAPLMVIGMCSTSNIPGDDKYFAFVFLKNEEIKTFVKNTAPYCWKGGIL